MTLPRPHLQEQLATALQRSRIVALLGPRQCGKTTLARTVMAPDQPAYFDLEDPVSAARLGEPMTALAGLRGLVVIDEIQRAPQLFQVLRVLADRDPLPARFLILGSASPEVIKGASESLAGRVEMIPMGGFHLAEVGAPAQARHWSRGGFPLSYLAASDKDSFAWRKNFIRTFLEQDLPQFGLRLPAQTFLRFWSMLAHYHGQVWNGAEPARALGVSESTVRRYLDLLEGTFLIRTLQPWFANISKRQVKAPKLYFRDSGLLHHLLGIHTPLELETHPKVGASWEGYAVEEILAATDPDEAYFWATHTGAELDLLLIKEGRRIGIECKRVDAPKLTPSIKAALADLELDQIAIVYPGSRSYSLSDQVKAIPLASLASPEFLAGSPFGSA
ncbi:MAG: ATP-binding protein [Holophaga sp.]|nr:ATP-binding protein [Holophaga sp.]